MKGTRGTRDFPRDALAYTKWLQCRNLGIPDSLADLRLIARAAPGSLSLVIRPCIGAVCSQKYMNKQWKDNKERVVKKMCKHSRTQ